MTYNQCPFCVDVDDNLLTQSVLIKAYLSASLFPPNILLPPPLFLLIYPPSLFSPKTFLSLSEVQFLTNTSQALFGWFCSQ